MQKEAGAEEGWTAEEGPRVQTVDGELQREDWPGDM